jgi:hypothetical protein
MTLDTRLVTAVNGFGGVGATVGGDVSTEESWDAAIGEIIFGDAAASARASANTATGPLD